MCFNKTHCKMLKEKNVFLKILLPLLLFPKRITQKFHIKTNFRSSRQEMFCKKDLLRNFATFTAKHLFLCKDTLAQVLSCEFCGISKSTFSSPTPPDDCFYMLCINLLLNCWCVFSGTFFMSDLNLLIPKLESLHTHLLSIKQLLELRLPWTATGLRWISDKP